MSAKSKLKIATSFLKEVGDVVSNDIKDQVKEDLSKLELLVNSYDSLNDTDEYSERMAYSILKDVAEVCFKRLDAFYGYNTDSKFTYILELIGDKKVYSKKELNDLLMKLINNEKVSEEIKDMNINDFIKEYGLEESSEEQ